MHDAIQLLPDSIANQIAAGEVVQRPASIIKELLENAIDAGASKITVVIVDAGRSTIQVIDDGKGMSENDARLCFEPHATSKIREKEDLFNIKTLGFRGEALASIASVSQVELKTKQEEQEAGVQVLIHGGVFKGQEPVAMMQGTSMTIKNVFYNVPARRKFLKSDPVENKHILSEFVHIAMAHPSLEMKLISNGNNLYDLSKDTLSQRIIALFGTKYQSNLLAFEEESPVFKAKGYIGKPESATKSRKEQFFFVNGRYIKSYQLQTAITQGYGDLLKEKHLPFFVINIEIDPTRIDINVHPTKTEIKFEDEQIIFALLKAGTKKTLGRHNITPSLDFDSNVNWRSQISDQISQEIEDTKTSIPIDRREGHLRDNQQYQQKKQNTNHWQQLYNENVTQKSLSAEKEWASGIKKETIIPSSINSIEPGIPSPKALLNETFMQVQLTYIISQVKSGLLILKQQEAHQRILYERFKKSILEQKAVSQRYLFPLTVELSVQKMEIVKDMWNEIESMGFVVEEFGATCVLIHGGPADLSHVSETTLFEGILEQFEQEIQGEPLEAKEQLIRAIAKRSCLKAGKVLTNQEMKNLFDQLFACDNPNYDIDGQKIYKIIDMVEIQELFKR